jgi:hypothetical protein
MGRDEETKAIGVVIKGKFYKTRTPTELIDQEYYGVCVQILREAKKDRILLISLFEHMNLWRKYNLE